MNGLTLFIQAVKAVIIQIFPYAVGGFNGGNCYKILFAVFGYGLFSEILSAGFVINEIRGINFIEYILRNGHGFSLIIFPAGIRRGDYGNQLSAGDDVLLLTSVKDVRQVEDYLGIAPRHPHNIAVLGGGLVGYYLAEMLEKSERRYNVKIFEPDREQSEEMASLFSHTTVINCSADTAISMFEDENVGGCDLMIAASEDDKVNLFACVVAHNLGVGKTISQVRGEYAYLVEQTPDTDKVVSPNRLTLNTILSFINRNRVLSLTRFVDCQGQITEFLVPEDAPAAGRLIRELHMPLDALICMIIRQGRHLIPKGDDRILPGDSVIVFSLPEAMEKIEQLLSSGKDQPRRED